MIPPHWRVNLQMSPTVPCRLAWSPVGNTGLQRAVHLSGVSDRWSRWGVGSVGTEWVCPLGLSPLASKPLSRHILKPQFLHMKSRANNLYLQALRVGRGFCKHFVHPQISPTWDKLPGLMEHLTLVLAWECTESHLNS